MLVARLSGFKLVSRANNVATKIGNSDLHTCSLALDINAIQ